MPWRLTIWFGYSDCGTPPLVEEYDVKADGLDRAAEVLVDGYTETSPGAHHHWPASAITHVELEEFEIEEED